MKTCIFISLVALATGLAGCAVGPDYHRPAALPDQPLPKTFSDGNPTNRISLENRRAVRQCAARRLVGNLQRFGIEPAGNARADEQPESRRRRRAV